MGCIIINSLNLGTFFPNYIFICTFYEYNNGGAIFLGLL